MGLSSPTRVQRGGTARGSELEDCGSDIGRAENVPDIACSEKLGKTVLEGENTVRPGWKAES